jgi:hypothetical protein
MFNKLKVVGFCSFIGLLVGISTVVMMSKGDPAFAHLVLIDPKSSELDSAFQMFEKDTGKSRNEMSYNDIYVYVQKARK